MLQAFQSIIRHQASSKTIQAETRRGLVFKGFRRPFDAAREDQTFQLSDGRTLGFAEYGSTDGTPLFYLHGSPSCRYDAQIYDQMAKKMNVRVIAPDRPGYGLSSFIPDQKLSEYPDDVAQLAGHLGLTKYHLFGESGGGPYAVACAYRLPPEKLQMATVLNGMGHPGSLTLTNEGLRGTSVLLFAKWMPSLMRSMMEYALLDEEGVRRDLKKYEDWIVGPEEQKVQFTPDEEADQWENFKMAYAQGPDGALRDTQICAGPWDFELQHVHSPVRLIFGLKDGMAKVAHGRYYKEHLPDAELVEMENLNHFNVKDHQEEILKRVLGIWKPQPILEIDE